ncbi:MAG: nucleotide exchange factor GrpE [Firmicutes bacterium]|nr:nucleotide exchange factor GrpE [Bacillota bacterium]
MEDQERTVSSGEPDKELNGGEGGEAAGECETKEVPASKVDSIEARIASLEARLAEETKQKEYYLAGWQRTQADFENYKKRIAQERKEFERGVTDSVLRSFLPLLDNLDAAFAFVKEDKSDDPVFQGIGIIKKQVAQFLEREGMTPIEALGKPYDPKVHEALQQVIDNEVEEGTVVREVRKGYMYGDRVLRPSLVIVSKKSEENTGGKAANENEADAPSESQDRPQ